MTALLPRLAAFYGFLAVGLGAFGAHGLKDTLSQNATAAIWETAVLYHLAHAVASLWASERHRLVAWFWLGGITIFSGSLYVLALTNLRWMGAITPLGGVLLLVGWFLLIIKKS
ncbi:MAG: DUF423 domain-containing protein [Terrimicrobiaceae bacterium]